MTDGLKVGEICRYTGSTREDVFGKAPTLKEGHFATVVALRVDEKGERYALVPLGCHDKSCGQVVPPKDVSAKLNPSS